MFEATGDVVDVPRSGRPRATTEQEDEALVMASIIEHFDTPRGLKRKLGLDVSRRTIDRRLIEADLFGRVASKKRKFT